MTIEKHERSTKDLVKAAVSGWLGTALEFMDFKSHASVSYTHLTLPTTPYV